MPGFCPTIGVVGTVRMVIGSASDFVVDRAIGGGGGGPANLRPHRVGHHPAPQFAVGVGIAGLALGFAVKDSLANIFGGISLILDKAVQVGDYIEVNGTSGEVVDVGLRSTRIRTWDNELLIMPNGTLANSEFKNWKLLSVAPAGT